MAKRFMSYLNNYEVEMKEKGNATFKSYISDLYGDEEEVEQETKDEEIEEIEKSASQFFDSCRQPSLLSGESVITQADSVLRFALFSDRKQGISGNLFVTNFKLAFMTADRSSYANTESKTVQRNKLIDDSDIPLTNIDSIYQVLSGGRKRLLVPGTIVNSLTKYLEIHCKNFQIHVFGFKFSPKEHNKRVTQAIIHHVCPTHDDLLFAYEFALCGKFTVNEKRNMFYDKRDWEHELERLKCRGHWHVTEVNLNFQMSTSLPEYFVTPADLIAKDLKKSADQYIEKRLPTWSYTCENGASLVRMSQLLPQSDFKTCEENVFSAIKRANVKTQKLEIFDLSQLCPSVMEIFASSQRLMSLCMTDSVKEFYSQDSSWLSCLDGTQWLQHISKCLKTASDVVNMLQNKKWSVALKEETGYDLCCVVSCLAQMLMDPEYRTREGFSALVQREWVVMGHPFQRRSHLVYGPESEQSPVFLLFLDCVWQLLQQFPSRFGFTETFLTTLWDTQQLGLFDTFLFDSAWQRKRFYSEGRKFVNICLPSVWEWNLQFSEQDIMLFNNPLNFLAGRRDLEAIITSARSSLKHSSQMPKANSYAHKLGDFYQQGQISLFKMPDCKILEPVRTTVGTLQLWSQCYLRWCVPSQILCGGRPSEYLQQCLLVEEVVCLHHKLKILEERKASENKKDNSSVGLRPKSGLIFSLGAKTLLDSGFLTSSFPFPAAVTEQYRHKLINEPLALYLSNSIVHHDYNKDSED